MVNDLPKLKNLWNNLNLEINSPDKLPENFLISKILDTSPQEYFTSKSSWQLISKSERTVENLTSTL